MFLSILGAMVLAFLVGPVFAKVGALTAKDGQDALAAEDFLDAGLYCGLALLFMVLMLASYAGAIVLIVGLF